MTTHHWDAVVVTGDHHVEGIFTATDAVRVLRDLVQPPSPRALTHERL